MRQIALAVFLVVLSQAAPPAPRQLTADDYARAERFLGVNTAPPLGETNSFQTAATVRFNTANQRIEARNNLGYAASSVAWTAGQTYRIRLVINDDDVAPEIGTRMALASNQRRLFRVAGITLLDRHGNHEALRRGREINSFDVRHAGLLHSIPHGGRAQA